MRKQQIRTSAIAALVLSVIAAVILMSKPESNSGEQIAAVLVAAKPVSKPTVNLEPVNVDKVAPMKVVKAAPALTAPEKKQLAEQLDLFHELNVKVLMNPDERERYLAMLGDSKTHALIRKAILRADSDNRQIQNRSVELLVSAMESGVDVSSIIKDIVVDASIESEDFPREVRQVQAELKAELLYSWTSHNPNEAAGVAGLLPGPVSQRMWNNIVQAQANNAEESLTVQ